MRRSRPGNSDCKGHLIARKKVQVTAHREQVGWTGNESKREGRGLGVLENSGKEWEAMGGVSEDNAIRPVTICFWLMCGKWPGAPMC